MKLEIKLKDSSNCVNHKNVCPCYTVLGNYKPYCRYYRETLELGFNNFIGHKTFDTIPRPEKCIKENGK